MNFRIFVIITFFLISTGAIFPAVPFPHGFYGDVLYTNGSLVDSGNIIAKMNNIVVGQDSATNGQYNLVVQSQVNFGTIYFYYSNGTENFLATVPFGPPGNVTQLNFVISGQLNNSNNQTNNSTNSTLPHESCENCGDCKHDLFIKVCDVNWDCTGWSECENGVMKRKCTDTNNCEYEYNKPRETATCENTMQKSLIIEEENNILRILMITNFLIMTLLLFIFLFTLLKKR